MFFVLPSLLPVLQKSITLPSLLAIGFGSSIEITPGTDLLPVTRKTKNFIVAEHHLSQNFSNWLIWRSALENSTEIVHGSYNLLADL